MIGEKIKFKEGDIIGHYTFIELAEKDGYRYIYKVKCNLCGTIKNALKTSVIYSTSITTCKCNVRKLTKNEVKISWEISRKFETAISLRETMEMIRVLELKAFNPNISDELTTLLIDEINYQTRKI